ncbi:short-chain collagen C4-like isoform X2 [Branchiostoma lanceolatum]
MKTEAASIRKSMESIDKNDVASTTDYGEDEGVDDDIENRQLRSNSVHVHQAASVTYVRWGKKTCPQHAELVYEGVIGGSHYGHSGGGANYLCMPYQPTYDAPATGGQTTRGLLYGSQYYTNDFEPYNQLYKHDPPCAVCRVSARSTTYTVPARNVCPSGWNVEYTGYMMTSQYGQRRTQFICMDENADYVFWTSYDQGTAAMLYPVEVMCVTGGSIPCAPYVNGDELTCVVCTS